MCPIGCYGAGLAGESRWALYRLYSTCLDSHSWLFKHCLAAPIDADHVAGRAILNINKVLMNLQRILIKSLDNL